MPAEEKRWETLDALRNSEKGRLQYDSRWLEEGEDLLQQCRSSPKLSVSSAWVLDHLFQPETETNTSENLTPLIYGLTNDDQLQEPSVPPPDQRTEEKTTNNTVQMLPDLLSFSSNFCFCFSPEKEVLQISLSSLMGEPKGAKWMSHLRLLQRSPASQILAFSQFDSFHMMPRNSFEVLDTAKTKEVVQELTPEQTLLLLSPEATQIEGYVKKFEEAHKFKSHAEMKHRQELHQRSVQSFSNTAAELLKRFEESLELEQRQEYEKMRDMMEKGSIEAQGRQEKLKEEHRRRAKNLNLKLREAEQQRLRQEELERQKQAESRERVRKLNCIQAEVLHLNLQIEPYFKQKELVGLDLSGYSNRGNQLCSLVSGVIKLTSEGGVPLQEDILNAERALLQMRELIADMHEKIAAAAAEKKRIKEEEEKALQKKQEVKAEVEKPVPQEKASRKEGLQIKADASSMQWYQHLQDICDQCAASINDLNNSKDFKVKKIKMDLQKAATIPVGQISSIAGSHLREIFEKINNLLLGKQISSGGKMVAISQHPQGKDFVCYKLAEKFVKQGEEEVASHHEAAFPIAVVASGIWESHPKVGDLFLAHLHRKCPYAVPFFPSWKDGQQKEEYQRLLGYRVLDNGVEQQDNFLKRMSGMIRLYAAIILLRWPYGSKQAEHPHGLNHAWHWLAQMLNMEPLADITATLLYDFLEVCGNALMKKYQNQFWKMIVLIKNDYFPRIEAVTGTGQVGAVIRLRQFLEKCLKQEDFPLPKGYLHPAFWRS
ncbi:nucleoporin GLE1 isoform X2 [Chiloscyllium plagiosum]|uniref:nucleoporin GLE1 isoform X2 n=1 Tax=Chiloscyllium plagiosum TaxID=36176 RepID=UPI001CB7E451|nr:nucleoporin GLE1 isoform X2 [Chiloscyllium plagiosum]